MEEEVAKALDENAEELDKKSEENKTEEPEESKPLEENAEKLEEPAQEKKEAESLEGKIIHICNIKKKSNLKVKFLILLERICSSEHIKCCFADVEKESEEEKMDTAAEGDEEEKDEMEDESVDQEDEEDITEKDAADKTKEEEGNTSQSEGEVTCSFILASTNLVYCRKYYDQCTPWIF